MRLLAGIAALLCVAATAAQAQRGGGKGSGGGGRAAGGRAAGGAVAPSASAPAASAGGVAHPAASSHTAAGAPGHAAANPGVRRAPVGHASPAPGGMRTGTPAGRPTLFAPPIARPMMTTAPNHPAVPRGAQIYLPPRSGTATPTRSSAVPGRATPQVPRFSIDQGRVTFLGTRTFPHFIVYPAGGFYPVFYASYPWAGQVYDVPALAGLAVDEGFLELHLNPPDAAFTVDGVELGGEAEDGALTPVRPGFHAVEVYREGYRPMLINLTVAAGRAHPIWASLEPLPTRAMPPETALPPPPAAPQAGAPAAPEPPAERGSGTLKLQVPQSGAKVYIDGEPWGDARADAPGFLILPAGDHAVRVEIGGRRSFLTNVHIRNGAVTALDASPQGD